MSSFHSKKPTRKNQESHKILITIFKLLLIWLLSYSVPMVLEQFSPYVVWSWFGVLKADLYKTWWLFPQGFLHRFLEVLEGKSGENEETTWKPYPLRRVEGGMCSSTYGTLLISFLWNVITFLLEFLWSSYDVPIQYKLPTYLTWYGYISSIHFL